MVRPYVCHNDVFYIEKDNYLIGAESLCRDNKELALVLTYKFNGYNAESFSRFFNKFLNVK